MTHKKSFQPSKKFSPQIKDNTRAGVSGSFMPQEVIFAPTGYCNLACPHCWSTSKHRLSIPQALRFLKSCHTCGITRVGFSGGEPFLAPKFLSAVIARAVEYGMLFDAIATNAAWFSCARQLRSTVSRIYSAGYDGNFYVSVDALHGKHEKKIADFINAVSGISRRPDAVRIVSVSGVYDCATKALLRRLAVLLGAALHQNYMRSANVFIRMFSIPYSPCAEKSALLRPWQSRRWFSSDFCFGPGQVFYVHPDGNVACCCGYANDHAQLLLGAIGSISAKELLARARKNRFIEAVYTRGLHAIRLQLQRAGIVFPGKTDNHCFFCRYILESIPSKKLTAVLAK